MPNRARWAVVGREQEVDDALRLVTETPGVVLLGEPGVGKTTIATEVLAALGGDPDVRVARLPVHEGITTPWFVLGPLLGDTAAEMDLASMLTRARERLAAAPGRTVCYVDDAHLLDATSAVVLAELVEGGAAGLLATARHTPGLPLPLAALWRQGVLDRVDVRPLDWHGVAEVMRRALDGPVSRETSHAVWSLTGGNPLYARELVRAALESGALRRVSEGWVWTGRDVTERRLVDLVTAELDGLDPAERDVVDLVALAGPVPVDELATAVADAVLQATVHRGLVVLEHDGQSSAPVARMTHHVHAEIVRSLVLPERRRELFLKLPPVGGLTHPAHLFRWVEWALECGIEPGLDRLLEATHAAARLHDRDLVTRLAGLSLARLPTPGSRRADLLLVRAEAHRFSDRVDEARADLAEVAEILSRGVVDDSLVLRHAEAVADLQQYHEDDVEAALATLARAADRTTSAQARAELEISRLARLGYAGRFAESVPASLERLDPGEPATLRLVPALVLGLAQQGRMEHAVRLADEALASWGPRHHRFPWVREEISSARFVAALWAGDVESAVTPPPGSPEPTTHVDRAVQQYGTGLYYAAIGPWERSAAEFRGALSRFASRDPSGFAPAAWAGLAVACAALGDAAGAREACQRYDQSALRTSRALESECRYSIALVHAALGEPDAHERARAHITWSAERGLWLGVLLGTHLALLTARPPARPGLLLDLESAAAHVDGARPAGIVAHARAFAAGDWAMAGYHAKALAAVGLWVPQPGAQVRLTKRQREIAHLVVGGLSNREIAERLVISVRTVDSHVAQIFQRFGIARRMDLAAALARTTG